MTWVLVIGLALGAFAIAAFVFKLDKGLWTSMGAALGFGLAGYALQANPEMPAAPKEAQTQSGLQDVDVVAARRVFVSQRDWSTSPMIVTSDAMARRGRFADAAQLLVGVTRANPNDFEAWLAQGIALAGHADGSLTQASLYAYQQAANARPDNLAPGYFLGAALIDQGRYMEARQVWQETLANGPADATGRAEFEEALARLESVLGQLTAGQMPAASPPQGEPASAGETSE